MPLIICTRSSVGPSDEFGSSYVLPAINIGFTGGGDITLFSLDTTPEMNISLDSTGSATSLFTVNETPAMNIQFDSTDQPAATLSSVTFGAEMNITFGPGA